MTLAWQTPGGLRVLATDFTEQTVTNSTTETSLLNGGAGYTISSGTLVAGKALRFTMTGNVNNNSGGNINLTVKLKLGGTTFYSGVLTTQNGQIVTPQEVTAFVNANNASNSQRAFATWANLASNIADGSATAASVPITGGHSALTIDMAASQTFDATASWASANSSATFKRWGAVLELIG